MLDIRLDFISNFKNNELAIKEMSELREKYIALDKILTDIFECEKNPALLRTLAIARTSLETSLMYAIKTCCLAYEAENN